MLTNCKNGISSYEIARDVKVTQKSAWFMLHRIRLALQDDFFGSKLGGEVEVDETFIGGKARNMHVSERKRRITGTGTKDKTAVMGILERGGKVRAAVVPSRRKTVLQEQVYKHVTAGAALYSDALLSYEGLAADYAHQVVDHATEYVNGRVHTNGLENFWSLLKRGISGTYVSVEPFHLAPLPRRTNVSLSTTVKTLDDAGRFDLAVRQIAGKRITFARIHWQAKLSKDYPDTGLSAARPGTSGLRKSPPFLCSFSLLSPLLFPFLQFLFRYGENLPHHGIKFFTLRRSILFHPFVLFG